ncbi:carboxypeptidase-like regulatory domain-containing protein [Persicitalea jodogahamensis]|uniref:carboxypeptidase-like regulatory domain-containing protein n=1 Tax=Persicitalea jodogahamensis TaxID=402147 RepID=UPI0016757623|nr:carboxypeptidase-like regulatory domain-containing protein [Persicitalea jodogahamensis]
MKRRPIPWRPGRSALRFLAQTGFGLSVVALVILNQGCKPKEIARLTTVYGKVTDQAGQPVDSVTILFAGHKGVTGGIPIDETLTDSTGAYELVVDVPRKYLYASIVSSLNFEPLRSKYSSQNRLIFMNDVQQGSCCTVTLGGKTKYDFVLLPK